MTQGFPQQGRQWQQPAQPQQVPQYQQGAGNPAGNPAGGFFQQEQPPQFAPSAPQETDDTAGYFTSGAAWVSWATEAGYVNGTPRGGQVIGKRIVNQTEPETGKPRMSRYQQGQTLKQLVLTLQTSERADPEDDGKRQMPIKSGLTKVAKDAIEATGAKDVEIGGWFYAAKTGQSRDPQSGFRKNSFQAVYARPGSPDPMAGQPPYQAAVVQTPQFAPAAPPQAPAQNMGYHQQAPQQPAQFGGQTVAQFTGQTPPAQPAPVAAPQVPSDQAAQFAAWQAQQAQNTVNQFAAQPGSQAAQAAPAQDAGYNPFGPSA